MKNRYTATCTALAVPVEKRKKPLIATYHVMDGFDSDYPLYEDNNMIVLTGGESRWLVQQFDLTGTIPEAEIFPDLEKGNTLDRISEAFVYLGEKHFGPVMGLLKQLKSKNIETTLLGCECRADEKREIAREIGTKFQICECRGRKTIGDLIEKYQAR